MPFYLAWVYGKGQTFLENLHPNSLPLHMVVLENTTLFFGQFRKGNVSPWDRCDTPRILCSRTAPNAVSDASLVKAVGDAPRTRWWSMVVLASASLVVSKLLSMFCIQSRTFTLTDFLSILSMIMFSYMVQLSIFSDCDIKIYENVTQQYLCKSIK